MAIVEKTSTFYGDFVNGSWQTPANALKDGKVHVIMGSVGNALSNNSGSTYKLFSMPWSAILLPTTAFLTKDWGFAQAVIGTPGAPNGLLDAVKGSAVGGQLPITIFGSKWGKPLWEAVGLSAMPVDQTWTDIIATAVADATVAGSLSFNVQYTSHLG